MIIAGFYNLGYPGTRGNLDTTYVTPSYIAQKYNVDSSRYEICSIQNVTL